MNSDASGEPPIPWDDTRPRAWELPDNQSEGVVAASLLDATILTTADRGLPCAGAPSLDRPDRRWYSGMMTPGRMKNASGPRFRARGVEWLGFDLRDLDYSGS